MWMGKIGNKSASFINHKHFHPGNRENLEKVWLAEEKHKAALKRQKEMKEKLAEEIRITELKRQLREQEEKQYQEYLLSQKPPSKYQVSDSKITDDAVGLILTKKAPEGTHKPSNSAVHKVIIRSRYKEDIHEHGHSSIFGSYYNRDTNSWGYKCCKIDQRGTKCPNKPTRGSRRNVTKSAEVSSQDEVHKEPLDTVSHKRKVGDTSNNKLKHRATSTLADALNKLKQMDALD
ncbi:N-terminal domain of Cprotein BF1 interacting co-repressor CIR family protein [Babesia bovis T2Bo]|uniref:N-terminal domain of Cprotein BF1 interacting co-repressor CIR family protein n=1 Tax=Babesia bovis T2Bo TaxID=484906 RepID=UPI001DF1A2F8|nr:N-terminal domain of Cprotein BF1 interacting co-repressor CIR family protein [Babesia bovis T2Bo]KAG6439886.1 N-terminal domain of Cprotein BF1 interacting co-repressor CIR family protein [Babesia bovis T2Bo]